jgi:hypothetical protein
MTWAVRFYTELLGAFPDVHFDLQTIVKKMFALL